MDRFTEMVRQYDPFRDEVEQKRLQERDEKFANIFKALSSPVRIQILRQIAMHQSYCGDLAEFLGMAQSTVSHHLKVLRDTGLVHAEAEGAATCYTINHELFRTVQRWISVWSGKT